MNDLPPIQMAAIPSESEYKIGSIGVKPGTDFWVTEYNTIAACFYVPVASAIDSYVSNEDYREMMASTEACECEWPRGNETYKGPKHTHNEALLPVEI